MSARNALPSMPACTSCGKCCGPANARRDELKRIKAFLKDSGESWQAPTSGDPLRCGFLRDNGDGTYHCAVYPVRPWVCRAYGVVIQLSCPFFPEAAVVDVSADEAVATGRMAADSMTLGQYFEPGFELRVRLAIEASS